MSPSREITSRGRIGCYVTRYSVVDGELEENTREEETTYEVERGWLFLFNSAASAEASVLKTCARESKDWGAQAGTAPVRVDGHWGGRNYPKIVVPAAELQRVFGEEENHGPA